MGAPDQFIRDSLLILPFGCVKMSYCGWDRGHSNAETDQFQVNFGCACYKTGVPWPQFSKSDIRYSKYTHNMNVCLAENELWKVSWASRWHLFCASEDIHYLIPAVWKLQSYLVLWDSDMIEIVMYSSWFTTNKSLSILQLIPWLLGPFYQHWLTIIPHG